MMTTPSSSPPLPAPDVAARWPCCGLVCDTLAALVLLSDRRPPTTLHPPPCTPHTPPSNLHLFTQPDGVRFDPHCVFGLPPPAAPAPAPPPRLRLSVLFILCLQAFFPLSASDTHTHMLITHIIVSRHPIRLIAGPSPLFVCAG